MDDCTVKMSESGIYVSWKAAKGQTKPLFLAHKMRNKNKRKCDYLDVQKALKP